MSALNNNLFLALIACWDASATLAKTRSECEANKASEEQIQSTMDKMEKIQDIDIEERAESLFKVANSYGLDTDDRL